MPLCLICQTDYELIGIGHPPYPCDCGNNLGGTYARDYHPNAILQLRHEWQQRNAELDTTEAGA